jgi:hypothetical protein
VLITGGLVLMTAGLVILAVIPSAPVWALALLMIPVGLAGPLVMPPVIGVRQVGGALAIAVFGALLADRATFLPGLRTSLLLAAGVALAAAGISLLLKRPDQGCPGTLALCLTIPRLTSSAPVVIPIVSPAGPGAGGCWPG